jgi:hypothetical protein
MYTIPVYRAERELGLAAAIQASVSIAYQNPLIVVDAQPNLQERLLSVAAAKIAPVTDDGLYYLKDILVSTGWNLNDDIFCALEAYAARHTPEDKPLNFAHNQTAIIGHIVASWAVNDDMSLLADDLAVEDLPEKFHILNGTVIYRHIGGEDRSKLIEQTIEEIKAGEWFVSMECWLRGFDYGVRRADGTELVIARNEQTAHLTRFLRAYPPKDAAAADHYAGSGKFVDASTGEECRIGRIPRNLTFCGKGLVRKPANPESVILANVSTFTPSTVETVYEIAGHKSASTVQQESFEMPEPTNEMIALQEQLRVANANLETLNKEIESYRSKDTEATVAGLRAEVETKLGEITSLKAQLATVTEAVATLTARAESAEAELGTARTELGTIKAEKAKAVRLATLKDKGASDEAAASLVEKLSVLDDESFASTVETIAATWKTAVPPATSRTEAEITVVETAVVEPEPALAASTDDEVETSRAAVSEFFENSLISRSNVGRQVTE